MAEEWRVIPEFPMYRVSNRGRVFSLHGRTGRFIKFSTDSAGDGYYYAHLRRDTKRYSMSVARLVLFAFVGPPTPDQTDSRHLDGNPSNNYVENLAWGTRSENNMDKLLHGTDNRGEKHPGHKLFESDVWTIRRLIKEDFLSLADIAFMFEVCPHSISDIKHGEAWGWLK